MTWPRLSLGRDVTRHIQGRYFICHISALSLILFHKTVFMFALLDPQLIWSLVRQLQRHIVSLLSGLLWAGTSTPFCLSTVDLRHLHPEPGSYHSAPLSLASAPCPSECPLPLLSLQTAAASQPHLRH